MDKITTFTSTGSKFLHHVIENPDLLYFPKPISLQIALTEKCNLKCSFCSVVNRERKYEWDFGELLKATEKFISLGIKTIEITGGGEPLVYRDFEAYIDFLKMKDIEIGLITNGVNLSKYEESLFDAFSWVRISMNCLDYIDSIDIPTIKGTLGFSYVFGPDSHFDTLKRVVKIAKEKGAEYVRVVPNCLSTEEELEAQHSILGPLVEELGHPAFYQQKEYGRSKECYWCYFKPFLYCDGRVYPCSSIAINPDANKSFADSFAICNWKDVDKVMYSGGFNKILDVSKCKRCVFESQNNLISILKNKVNHINFI